MEKMIDKIEKFLENYYGVYITSYTMNSVGGWMNLQFEATPDKNNFYEDFKEFLETHKGEFLTINWSINYLIPSMYTPKGNNKQSGNDGNFIPIFIPF